MNFKIFQDNIYRKTDLEETITSLKALPTADTFSRQSLSVIENLSSHFLKSEYSRQWPQLTALGYWLRKGAIMPLIDKYRLKPNPEIRTARGLALHLPPANVDTLFVYSWVLSFLCGNKNIVRLPNDSNPVAQFLVESITVFLPKNSGQVFCQYNSDSDANQIISKECDLRVIWGGNEKVNLISKFPVKPDGLSIGFPDRKSLSILSESDYAAKGEHARDQLAKRFFNDVYWFDQMGCGSPRLLVWLFDQKPDLFLRTDFYWRLNKKIKQENYVTNPSIALQKIANADQKIGTKLSNSYEMLCNELIIINTDLKAHILDETLGGGSILEAQTSDITEIATVLNDSTQTITQEGVSQDQAKALLTTGNHKGFYRFVPVGDALNFNSVWDGIDLIEHFTRKVWIS